LKDFPNDGFILEFTLLMCVKSFLLLLTCVQANIIYSMDDLLIAMHENCAAVQPLRIVLRSCCFTPHLFTITGASRHLLILLIAAPLAPTPPAASNNRVNPLPLLSHPLDDAPAAIEKA
jgi:hypothetical protein